MAESPEDHYFTARPASDGELRRVGVRLAGRDVEVVTAGGIFSPDGIDKGTRVLLDEAPAPPATGTFLDLGCGWGPLALTMALSSPAATVHAVDVNERALDLCRRNAEALGCEGLHPSTPDGVPADTRFDLIWSNPPIRVGKAALHDLLTTWLPRLAAGGDAAGGDAAARGDAAGADAARADAARADAARADAAGADAARADAARGDAAGAEAARGAAAGADAAGGAGVAYLVVQKNLGSDSLQAWLARTLPDLMGPVEVTRAASSKGFRVLRVTRA